MAEFKEPARERFVALFDIMGFKDMVYRNGHDYVAGKMEKLQKQVASIESLGAAAITSGEDPELRILPVFFSDSILLVSEDDSEGCALGVVIASLTLLKKALVAEIPIKGAIAYGRQTADFKKSLHFGRPLVDAYLLAEGLQFYGAVLHHTMESYLKGHEYGKAPMLDTLVEGYLLSKCQTPFKGGNVNHYCLNWTKTWGNDEAKPDEVVSKLYDTVSGSTRHYVDNTLEFVNAIEASKPKK
jgi:hypothetical protein